MRDATEREEQFRQRIQQNPSIIETPKQETLITAPSTLSSSDSSNFHTPVVEQSPSVALPAPINVAEEKLDLKPIVVIEKGTIAASSQPLIRHTATEETQQAEYRPVVKMVPSRVLQSTIQNYLRDHDPNEKSDGNFVLSPERELFFLENGCRVSDEEETIEKTYDWNTIIANGPQFKYDDAFGN